MSRPSTRWAGGFTLIELLVVLAILALAAALLAPSIGAGRSGAALRAATRELAAALNATRSTAVARNATLALVLDPRRGGYRDPRGAHALPAGLVLAWRDLAPPPDGDAAASVFFFPDGSSTGGRINLRLGNVAAAIAVDWFTGAVTSHGASADAS